MATHPDAVLVVEDEDPLRAFLVDVIDREGFEVLAARGIDEALQLLDHHRHDVCVILVDPGLGPERGVEPVRRLREQHATVPVIAIGVNPQRLLEAQGAGATAVVRKPFYTLDLLAALHAHGPEERP